MHETLTRGTEQDPCSLEVVVSAASRLAGTEGIGAIHVVTNQRPTYAELVQYREIAEARDLVLNVAASSVSVRPRPEIRRPRGYPDAGIESWLTLALDWLSVHGRKWRAELSAMNEGTR